LLHYYFITGSHLTDTVIGMDVIPIASNTARCY